jgi:hypothetical protein
MPHHGRQLALWIDRVFSDPKILREAAVLESSRSNDKEICFALRAPDAKWVRVSAHKVSGGPGNNSGRSLALNVSVIGLQTLD